MDPVKFTLFDTALGRCGMAWSERGIVALQLPEANDAATRARMLRGLADAQPAEPTARVLQAIGAVVALLRGEPADLSGIAIDLDGVPAFHRRVYEAARRIVPGRTLTYGALAQQLGDPGAARAVGQALGLNPLAVIVPCHRVLAAGGRSGGFSANGGVATKLRLLTIERAQLGAEPGLFDGE